MSRIEKKRRKRVSILTAIVMILNTIINAILPMNTTFSEDSIDTVESKMSINDAELFLNGEKFEPDPESGSSNITLKKGDSIEFKANIYPKSGETISEGDTVSIQLPNIFTDDISIVTKSPFKAIDKSTDIVFNTENNTMEIIFTIDDDADLANWQGSIMSIYGTVDQLTHEVEGEISVENFHVNLITKPIQNLPDRIIYKDTIGEEGTNPNYTIKPNANGFNGKEVNYSIAINEKFKVLHSVYIKDTIPGGMDLKSGSINLNKITIDEHGNFTQESPITLKQVTDSIPNESSEIGDYYINGKDIYVYLGDIKEKYILTYTTMISGEPTNEIIQNGYRNTATITYGKENPAEESSTVICKPQIPQTDNTKTSISKTVTDGLKPDTTNIINPKDDVTADIEGKQITYQLIVNEKLDNIANLKLIDEIPEGMSYVNGSIKIYKEYGNSGYQPIELNNVDIKYPSENNGKLEINFGEANKIRYRVEYKLNIDDGSKQEYKNTATVYNGDTENGKAEVIIIPPTPKPITVINKKAPGTIYPNTENGELIGSKVNYTIDVKGNVEGIQNAILEDKIPVGMKLLVDTLTITPKYESKDWIKENSKPQNENIEPGKIYVWQESGQWNIKVGFGNLQYPDEYQIKYKTEITSIPEGGKFVNTAGIGDKSDTTESEIKTDINKKLSKTVSEENKNNYNSNITISPNQEPTQDQDGTFVGKRLNYRIVVNEGRNSLKNVSLTDLLPNNMKFDNEDSILDNIKIYAYINNVKTLISKNKITLVDNSEAPSTRHINDLKVTYNKDTQQLSIYFGDIDTRYDVEYTTIITKDIPYNPLKDVSYTNTAKLSSTGNNDVTSTANVKPQWPEKVTGVDSKGVAEPRNSYGTNLTIKPGKVEDIINKTINYQIIVNNDLKTGIFEVTDNIPEGMELQTDTIKVYKHLGGDTWWDVQGELDSVTSQPIYKIIKADKDGFKIEFTNTNDRFKIEYQTKIVEFKDSYKNEAQVTYNGNVITKLNSTVNTNKENITPGDNSTVISKDRTNPSQMISSTTDTVEYKVILNKDFKIYTNTTFTDVIPKGMKLNQNNNDENTFRGITINEIKPNGNKTNVINILKDKISITQENNQDKISINFGEIYNKYEIIYTCKVEELAGSYTNNATISSSEKVQEVEDVIKYNSSFASIFVDKNVNGEKSIELKEDDNQDVVYTIKVWTTDNAIFPGGFLKLEDMLQDNNMILKKSEIYQNNKLTDNGDFKIETVQNEQGNTVVKLENQKDILNANKSNPIEIRLTIDFSKVEPGTTVRNVVKNSTAIVKKGYKLKFKKVDSDDDRGLEGALFSLYKVNNLQSDKANGVLVKENLVSDSTGYVELSVNEHGFYYIKETRSPNGYEILGDGTTDIFEIKQQDIGTTIDLNERNIIPYIENKKTASSISVTKREKKESKDGKLLKGAEFTLYNKNGKTDISQLTDSDIYIYPETDNKKAIEVTNSEGIANFNNIKPGSYWIVETKAPDNYLKSNQYYESVEVTVGPHKTYYYEFENEYNGQEIQIQKQDKDTKQNLAGAEFTIYKYENNTTGASIKTIITDNQGIASTKLPEGTYFIKETKAPNGYVISDYWKNGVPFTVTKSNEILNIKEKYSDNTEGPALNRKDEGKLVITKVDANNTDTKLKGAEFIIESISTGQKHLLKTDVTGTAEINLPAGEYLITEVTAPEGYIEIDETKTITIESNKQELVTYDLTVENKLDESSIKVIKVDKEDNTKRLPGAVFTIYKQNIDGTRGDKVTDITTNAIGIATAKLTPGKYFIIETKAPDGYKLQDRPDDYKGEEFVVGKNQTKPIIFTYDNEIIKAPVEVTKVDDKTLFSTKLPGAEFTIKDANGKIVRVLITDEDGKATTELPPGIYTMQETKAPTGYIESSEIITFEVTLGQTEKISYTIKNEKDKGSIRVLKLDSENSSKLLEGAEFTIYKQNTDGTKGEEVTKLITNELGLSRADLEPGDYIIEETKAPTGYIQHTLEKTFTIEEKQEITLDIIFINEVQKGKVEVEKVDSNNPELKLDGAEFTIRDANGKIVEVLVTGKNKADSDVLEKGKGRVALPPGMYTMQETKAPTGYVESSEIKTFEVKLGQTETISYTVKNDIDTATLKIIKVDKDDNTKLLDGAKFTIYKQDKDGKKGDIVAVKTTGQFDTSGIIRLDLEPGDYIVEETKAPNGYIQSITDKKFTVKEDEEKMIEIIFENEVEKAPVEVTKVDDSIFFKKKLEGAEFTIKDYKGNIVGLLVTDKNGKASINLPPGIYTMQETKAPTGYVESSEIKTFEIKLGQTEKISYTIENKEDTSSIKIIKVDKDDNSKKLEGAEFTIYKQKSNGNIGTKVITITSNELGIARADLEPGNYIVVETKAPYGYITSDRQEKFTVTKNQKTPIEFTFVNETEKGSIEVEKVDEKDTSKKLSGAEFTVKNEVGKIVAILKTDLNGLAKAELSPGIYTMQETKAPTGYIESSNIETFEIKLGEKNKVFYQIKNKLDDSQLKIIKVDKDDHNKVLQGAEFTIKDEDGNIVEVITSNEIGIARAKLNPGVYTVEETKAPDGYIKLNEVKDFIVKENDESIVEFIFENELDDSNIVNPDEEYPDTPGDSDDSGGFEDNDTTNPPSNLGGSGSFKDNDNTNSSSPKTGDTGVVLYILLALGSSALLLGLNRKNKNNKKAK